MTYYFDECHNRIRTASLLPHNEAMDAFSEIEQNLVRDCGIALEIPVPLPDTYRDRFDALVFQYGVETRPVNAPKITWPEDESEDGTVVIEWYAKRLHDLCWHLHTLWHEIAEAERISDNPTSRLLDVWCDVEERLTGKAADLPGGRSMDAYLKEQWDLIQTFRICVNDRPESDGDHSAQGHDTP